MQEREGGCLCGRVRYVLKAEPRAVAICHCTHCRKQSGSTFSLNLVMRESDYVQTGETTVYMDSSDSGQPVYRHFCAGCGSPIFAKTSLSPGKVIVKAGTLDSLEGIRPQTELYTDRALEWLTPVEGTERFARNL